jgi:hypothetical protein
MHDSQKIVERDKQRFAQRHGDGLLRRRQRRQQPMRRVAAVRNAVTLAPLVDGLRRHTEPFGKNRPNLTAGLNSSPDLWGRRSLLVKMDQHGRTPSRMSLRADIAVKSADRRGEM